MTKNKTLFIFFASVFRFFAFADPVSDCLELKQAAYEYIGAAQSANIVTLGIASDIARETTEDSIRSYAYSQYLSGEQVDSNLREIRSAVYSISCNVSNDVCNVDLGPLVSVCSNIYDVVSAQQLFLLDIGTNTALLVSYMSNFDSAVYDGHVNVFDSRLLSAVSNFNDSVSISFHSLTNSISGFYNSFSAFRDDFSSFHNDFLRSMSYIFHSFESLQQSLDKVYDDAHNILYYVDAYLPYLASINDSLSYLATNNVVSLDSSVLSNFFSSVRFYTDYGSLRFHQKGWKGLAVTDRESDYPFLNRLEISEANIADLLSGGFHTSLASLASLNNYWYWFFEKIRTNELNTAGITEGLSSLSNILSRVDSYVVGDFSNKFNEVVEMMNVIVTNQLEQLTNSNISALSALVETNNIYTVSNNLYLSSIDSKLDVLDYIKILSDTPFAEYSGDEDYFDYLTNLYLNGSVDSGVVTNWFERIEILLASLVFGDSDGTNGIPQGSEMEGFDSQTFENALTDYTFTDQFTSAVGNIETTSQNFMQILNGYHSAVKNVSKPASVSIGIFGMDTGSDTTTYEQLLDHSFQVSFDVGSVDRFTVVVRAVTTMCWVLLTLIFIWHCGFWICSKIQFFYRLMRLLINSIWLRS